MFREDEWIYREVMAPIRGAYKVNIPFAKVSPYATPFIYVQFNVEEASFAIVDRGWRQILLFNVDLFTKAFLVPFFKDYQIEDMHFNKHGEEHELFDFALQLCLTGTYTDLPLATILSEAVPPVPIEKPAYNFRHTMQQYGYNFSTTPLIHLTPYCGNYFGQSFDLTNHIIFYLQLRRQFGTLSPKNLQKQVTCTEQLIFGIDLFKKFAADAYRFYQTEPHLFRFLCQKKIKSARNGVLLLAQLDRTSLFQLARFVFLRNPAPEKNNARAQRA